MSHVHQTAIIGQDVVIGPGTRVGAYAVIEDHVVLGRDNVIYPQAFIGRGTTLGDRNAVHPGAIIGHLPQDLSFDAKLETFTHIGNDNVFREHCQVHRATKAGAATIIGDKNLLMALSHVAHDCKLGNNVVLVNQASLPGHCHVGDRVIMSGFTGIHQFCRIGRLAMVSALSVSNKDLPPFFIYGGRPARAQSINAVGLRRAGVSRESRLDLKRAYKLLYREGLTIPEALVRIGAECKSPEAQELVEFIRASKRGVAQGTLAVDDALSLRKGRAGSVEPGDEDDDDAIARD
jgi:UDP-N-acetylglucosamine acyltransferase